MIIYESTKDGFQKDVVNGTITDAIYSKYKEFFGLSSESQIASWKNSTAFMSIALYDARIPDDAGIAIEFNIPTTSKRVDFIISGYDNNNKEAAIIIELKQWSSCTKVEGKDGIVVAYTGHALRETTHPSYQVESYRLYLQDYCVPVTEEPISLHPCAYLHNYNIAEHPDIIDEIYGRYTDVAPVYGEGDVAKLRDFICSYVVKGDRGKALFDIAKGKIQPSRMLQDALAGMLKHNREEFHMIDDQKVIFEKVMHLAEQSRSDGKKRVIIIEGGPGTGKTVVAMNLLSKLTSKGMLVNYATKNATPRNVYYAKLKGDDALSGVKNLFKNSDSYTESEDGEFDVLLCDEAHRLVVRSRYRGRKGSNQIRDIIHAAKLSVFFIDEDQHVELDDIGNERTIKLFSEQEDAIIDADNKLESQFRCNGSDGYLSWLDNLLGIRPTANLWFEKDFGFDFRVFDDPNEMRKEIEKKNSRNKARIVAGYCWDWMKNGKNDTDIHDITIPEKNFEMSWNLGNSSTWAIDRNSIKEAGCIHTCQGLEFDYVGVIIGDDMRYDGEKVITDYTKRAKTDKSLFGIKKMMSENPKKATKEADIIIRNTYRTLMTRGMKGCYVFCTDKALSDYFKTKYEQHN